MSMKDCSVRYGAWRAYRMNHSVASWEDTQAAFFAGYDAALAEHDKACKCKSAVQPCAEKVNAECTSAVAKATEQRRMGRTPTNHLRWNVRDGIAVLQQLWANLSILDDAGEWCDVELADPSF